jgi:hypothetical protein
VLYVLLKKMSDQGSSLKFIATNVSCSEAIDWEIVRVTFDTVSDDFDENLRCSPYLSLSVNFEFDEDVQIEFYDDDYNGGILNKIDLWRHQVRAYSDSGLMFDICFKLSTDRFTELRSYLKVLCRKDCFRGSCPRNEEIRLTKQSAEQDASPNH